MASQISSTPPKVSLREVMGEQLAESLQEKERRSAQKSDNSSGKIANSSMEEQDDDLKLALLLSQQEITNYTQQNDTLAAHTEPDTRSEEETQWDSDFLVALKLQNELDSEQYARHLQEKERIQIDPLSKVSYSYDVSYQEKYRGHQFYEREYLDSIDGSDEEDDEGDECGLPDSEIGENAKPYHQTVKTNGRVQKKEIITKHDAEISGVKNAQRIERIMDSGNLNNIKLSTPVYNSLKQVAHRQESERMKVRGNRVDKSTHEQVLDSRTRVMLLKMLNSDVLSEIHGVVSTGKEANVYHAVGTREGEEPVEYAIKIYKTTLNEFKNRTEYIEGEFRFRRQNTSNPKRLIKVWAEKETRNLKRLCAANIPCPTPIALKENILVMSFIGKSGFPAPILKDTEFTEERLQNSYTQCCKLMRGMYQKSRLIHADLSEYNIMYHKGKLYVIDVSQAVESDHPNALEFLKKDCNCMVNFFTRRGLLNCMSPRELFNFIVDTHIKDDEEDAYLHKMLDLINGRSGIPTEEERIEDQMFQETFIPRNLSQVPHPIKELFDHQLSFHQSVHGLNKNFLDSDPLD